MTKRQRVSDVAGTPAIETAALRLGVTRKTRTNLAPNPTCSVNTTGWVGNAGTGGSGSSGRGSGATGLLGNLTYHRTTFTSGPSVLNTAGTTIGSAAAGASAIAVVPGWVSVTAYGRSSIPDRTAQIQVTFYNAAGAAIGAAINSSGPPVAIGSAWSRLFWLGEAPALAARITVRIYAVAGAAYVNGSTFDTGALLVETNSTVTDTIDGYFDGDSSNTWATNAWTGTAGASTSTMVYSANLLALAPNGDLSTPEYFPPGMSAWLVVGGMNYPMNGMLVVHKADSPASVVDAGVIVQTLYPDPNTTFSHSSKTYTRAWNDQLGWNEWTSARIVSDKVGNDLYLQVAEPDFPVDGDLWVSPGVTGPANMVTAAGNLFVTGTWYRIASTYGGDPAGTNAQTFPAPRASARFILENGSSGRHDRIEFAVSMAYGTIAKASVRMIDRTSYNAALPSMFSKIRIVYKGTYDQWHLEVFCASTVTTSAPIRLFMFQDSDWISTGYVLNTSWGAVSPTVPALTYLNKEWVLPSEGSDLWTPVTFLNNWANYGAPYENCAYQVNAAGELVMRGLTKNTVTIAAISAVCALPAAYWPANRRIFPGGGISNGGATRIDVQGVDGQVLVQGYTGTVTTLASTFASLDAIRYRLDPV